MTDVHEAQELIGGIEEIRWATRDAVEGIGFAMMSHAATLDQRISAQAYRLYALYKMYSQLGEICWPSAQLLCEKLGISQATLTRLNDELVEAGYIKRIRLMNRTWRTEVHREREIPYLQELASQLLAERAGLKTLDSSKMRNPDSSSVRNPIPQICAVEEEPLEGESCEKHMRGVSKSVRIETADPHVSGAPVVTKKPTLAEQIAEENRRADAAAKAYQRTVQARSVDDDGERRSPASDLEVWLAHLARARSLTPGQVARLKVKPKVVQQDAKTVTEGYSVEDVWAHPAWRAQFQEEILAKVDVVKKQGVPLNGRTVVGMACNFRPDQKGIGQDGTTLSTTPAKSRPVTNEYDYMLDDGSATS